MTSITPQVYKMSREGDKYTFVHQDGYLSIKIEGTVKEIAYECFKKHIRVHSDGYGIYPNDNDEYGPFWTDVRGEEVLIYCSIFAGIEPEPEAAFWQEMEAQFKRFMKLVAFS